MSLFLFRHKVSIRIAGAKSADLKGRQPLLLQVKLQGVN